MCLWDVITFRPLLAAKNIDPQFWIRREICTDQAPFTSWNSPKQQIVGGFWCERRQEMDYFTGRRVIMEYSLSRKQQFEVKTSCWISFSFSLLQMLTDGLECCRLSWYLHQLLGRFEQMFIFKWTIPLRMYFCTENGYGFIRSVLRVYFMFISCCQKWFVSHHSCCTLPWWFKTVYPVHSLSWQINQVFHVSSVSFKCTLCSFTYTIVSSREKVVWVFL